MIHPPFGRVYGNILGIRMSQTQPSKRPRQTPRINPPLRSILTNLFSELLHHYWTVSFDSNGTAISSSRPFQRCMIRPSSHSLEDVENGFCKSDQKSMPVVGLLTCNDCDVLRAKTGLYRRVTHRTIIPPTSSLPRSTAGMVNFSTWLSR